MSLESEYKQFDKLHSKYEVNSLRVLLKEFRSLFKSINFDNLSFDTKISEAVIKLNLNYNEFERILYRINYTTGIQYGNIVARQLRKDNPIELKKWKPLPLFNEAFQLFLINYYAEYGGENIVLLTDTMVKAVVDEIINGTYENETVKQMQQRIFKTVNSPNFYKWQALRIARTETTFAMNAAKETAGEVSGVLMDKVWITRLDGRERDSHMRANGQRVERSDRFDVSGYKMKYPGDRSSGAPARESVNCRCTMGFLARRDENGRLIFTD